MTFQPIPHTKIAEAITQQIEELILQGVLRPGDRLPPERELADTMEVSRPSLRDALTDLESRGLLVVRQGGGTFVANVMGSVFAEPILDLFGRHQKATADYLEFRREMEGIAARYAAERATDADKKILGTIFDAMLAAHDAKDATEEARLDVELHTAIVDASHNLVLIQTLRSIYDLLRTGVFYNRRMLYENSDGRDRLLAQHRDIYQHVIAGDAQGAERAATGHIDFVSTMHHLTEVSLSRQEISQRRLEQRQRLGKKRPVAEKSKRKIA